jgi:hypothetical protein
MNCPHGTATGPGVSCSECDAMKRAAITQGHARIARDLAECDHPGQGQVIKDTFRWCDRCGAIDLSGTGRGFVPTGLAGYARRLAAAAERES